MVPSTQQKNYFFISTQKTFTELLEYAKNCE